MLALNDNGRAALGPKIGAAVESVEGTLASHSDSGYVLRMTGVTYMNGQTNKWTNEPLTVSNQFVGEARSASFAFPHRARGRNRGGQRGTLCRDTGTPWV